MRAAWGVSGAGHLLRESFESMKKLKEGDSTLTTFVSKAGEEVLRMYGLFDRLGEISGGGYLEEIYLESAQGASAPKAGRFLIKKYDVLIVSPATSNTVAKIAHGVSDTLITNAVAQAVKGGVPVYVVPVDVTGTVRSELPYIIDRNICETCEPCPPGENCRTGAIADYQIDLLRCTGCGECVELCEYGAIKGGFVELAVRDVDSRNVQIVRGLEGITVLESPEDITFIFK